MNHNRKSIMEKQFWINVLGTSGEYRIEAFVDGESYGQVISDAVTIADAANGYLAPFGLEVDPTTTPVELFDTQAIQFRVIESTTDRRS